MGQDDAESYLQKKYEMENDISESNKRVLEPGDNDNRIFIESADDLLNMEGLEYSDATLRKSAHHIDYERGPVWIDEDGKIRTRCPICKNTLTVTSIRNHLINVHDKTYAYQSDLLVDYVPRDEKVKIKAEAAKKSDEKSDEKSEANDVFDKMRRLKEDYPRLFESLTGEQLKLILEDE